MKIKQSSNTKELFEIKSYPTKNYEGFDLDRLVVYALYVLSKKKIPLYFDFIAVGLFKLFPRKFSMASFIQYPDTNRINKALRRLTDQKRRRWATGNIENGFSLTDLGIEIAKQVEDILRNPEAKKIEKKNVVKKSRGRSSADDVREVRASDAFKKRMSDQDVNNYEFFAFLKAAPYTPKQLLAGHLKRLIDSAKTEKDNEVVRFLSWLEDKFNTLIK